MEIKRVFVWLPGGGKARIITDEGNVEGKKLKLGVDYVSRVLGRGAATGPDGVRRVRIKKVKEIK